MNKKFADKLAKPNETIEEHTNKLIEQANNLLNLGYLDNDDFFNDLITACNYHDYGKANLQFQQRIKKHYKFNENEEIPHNILSLFFIDENKCKNYTAVAFAVLYHHYRKKSPTDIFYNEKKLIKKQLNEMDNCGDSYSNLYDCIYDIGNLFELSENDKTKKYAILLKGFLHKCDYSASANIDCEYANNFLNESIMQWENENNIIQNELQNFCNKNTDNDIIVTAPTGMGKTEAGLLWCGNNKCFFILPLKTAINAMYQRIQVLSGSNYKNRVALVHSDMKSYYFNDNQKNESGEFDFEYCTRSRQMSLPITVCTPDQIFDFVLKYAGYEYKLATASYSKFIIDEIQMYSADLLASIIHGIKTIHNFGGKFAILTATMPPFVRSELKKIFGQNVIQKDFSSFGIVRHNVKVFEECLNSEYIFNSVQKLKSDTVKKFLIVCNSIDTADKIFDNLKEKCDDGVEVNLFHAKFIKEDRKNKEQQIMLASQDRTKTEIWISTSVVEASLDIDFDILFTELSDVFSLFQRFGRVNRKGKKSYKTTNCFVFTELQGNAKHFHFTDDTIYNLSKQAILSISGVITEQDKTDLIEKYLSVENLKDSKYIKDYRYASDYLDNLLEYEKITSEKLRNIDTINVIPESVYNNYKQQIDEALNVLADVNSNTNERLKMTDFINGLTVSVSKYNCRKVIKKIRLRYGEISILGYCTYNSERGLEIDNIAVNHNNIEEFWI